MLTLAAFCPLTSVRCCGYAQGTRREPRDGSAGSRAAVRGLPYRRGHVNQPVAVRGVTYTDMKRNELALSRLCCG
ncbi:hypothetical protein EYF80_054786 [Liparis tanakae]|uniref:Uncharacterized protein n=1 Tax=Liparis tanakae TaxID=230148 RepID=A0A4Z2F1G8_9TELE|nr:hypothetical protein EYF80_054786 [Liparis tanakae]